MKNVLLGLLVFVVFFGAPAFICPDTPAGSSTPPESTNVSTATPSDQEEGSQEPVTIHLPQKCPSGAYEVQVGEGFRIEWCQDPGENENLNWIIVGGLAGGTMMTADDLTGWGVFNDPLALISWGLAGAAVLIKAQPGIQQALLDGLDSIEGVKVTTVTNRAGVENWATAQSNASAAEGEGLDANANAATGTGANIRVAVIDDHANWGDLLIDVLMDIPGVSEATWFPSCETAIAAPDLATYNVITVDNDMGRGLMAGPECVAAIRERVPGAIIIGCTSSVQYHDDFMDAGANGFMDKMEAINLPNIIQSLLK